MCNGGKKMKNTIKKIAAAIAAISVIGTASVSVSAATKEDVIAAARGAGFLEIYVQQLQNYLNVTKFTPEQYDIMVNGFSGIGSEMDDIAMQYFGKTVAQMKGEAQDNADPSSPSADDSWIKDLEDKMTDDNVLDIIDQIVQTGKDLDLDVTVEKKDEKSFLLTVKDQDGNIQFVTPVGKLVDRTGVSETESNNTAMPSISFAGLAAAGCLGVFGLGKAVKSDEE